MWLSDKPVTDPVGEWTRHEDARAGTGLWPVLFAAPHPLDRPGRLTDVDAVDLPTRLERDWRAYRVDQLKRQAAPFDWSDAPEGVEPWPEDPGAPFDQWPGLASGTPAAAGPDPDEVARAVVTRLVSGPGPMCDPHLALVPGVRSADIPVLIGWWAEAELDLLCAQLRSWEERFGARVVAFDKDWIHISVARPPKTGDEATHLALEHVLTGADNLNDGTLPYSDYAASLIDCHLWSFWWD